MGGGSDEQPQKNENNQKDIIRRFVSAIIVIAILSILITWAIKEYAKYNGSISSEAQVRIDSLNTIILIQTKSIYGYQKTIDTLVAENKELQAAKEANTEKIKAIKNEYKKRASNAASYNAGELDSFFSNRYH